VRDDRSGGRKYGDSDVFSVEIIIHRCVIRGVTAAWSRTVRFSAASSKNYNI
jgi:hypothetical protein